ncbi:MAG: MFS transporter [Deltaproteobacteria bacterium]|nr:MFS transporter [Deltaproteobacteria bacterium]
MSLKIKPMYACFLAIFTAGFGFGIVLPVSTVVLEGMRVATPMIGFTATVMFAGIALGAPLAGRSIELLGLRRTLTLGILLAGACMGSLGLVVYLPVWLIVRFILGVAFASIFTSAETIVNRICTDRNRGKVLGLYAFSFSLALMIGPVGLLLLKFGVWAPFLVAGGICLVAAAVVFASVPHLEEESTALAFDRHLARRIWMSLSAMLMAGFMEGALIALIPLYTLREGFTTEQTSILLFSFMLGHGGMPPVIGSLGDRIGLRKVLVITYGLGVVSLMTVLLLPTTMLLTCILVLCGASVGALYPLAVGLLGIELTSSELPRGNALTTFCYGLGSTIGPLVPALIIHITVPGSLFAVTAGLYAVVLIAMGFSRKLS